MLREQVELVRTATGSFEVAEECDSYEVSGLGFAPTNVIVCEEQFKVGNVNMATWVYTDVFSCQLRYTAKGAVQPAIINQVAGKANNKNFLELTED